MARYIDADALKLDIDMSQGARITDFALSVIRAVQNAPTADVAPRAEVFEAVDKFRSDLMGKFIDLCRGNDFNKLTLLKIDDVVCEIYDKQIAELKKKYTQQEEMQNETQSD